MSQRSTKLGSLRAIWNAFCGRDISYYPQVTDAQKNKTTTLPLDRILQDISSVVSKLDIEGPEAMQPYLDRGRESLDEVKSLTEYQDQKATRLLTIIAFLSALSGALFTKFVDLYPLNAIGALLPFHIRTILIVVTYAMFALFILSAISGALVIFHATRTKFKYPSALPEDQHSGCSEIRSYLFYSDIVSMSPTAWAKTFVHSNGFVRAGGQEEAFCAEPELPAHYFRNYILETYLVACKVADKLRYLQPAQSILSFSIRVLFVWVIFMTSTWVFVAPIKRVTEPTNIRSTQRPAPLPISQVKAENLSISASE